MMMMMVVVVVMMMMMMMMMCDAGANVHAADEEGETCLHLAFARHAAAVNLDHADAIQQVSCKPASVFINLNIVVCHLSRAAIRDITAHFVLLHLFSQV